MNNQTQQVLKTMAYVNKSNVAFELPSTYLTPILDLIDEYGNVDEVTYKLYKPTTVSDSTNRVIAYPRVIIEAPLNIKDNEKQMKMAFLYALDGKETLFTSALGTELFSCTNLTLVGNDSVSRSSSYITVQKDLVNQLANAKKYYELFEEFREKNEKIILSEAQVRELLGKYILHNLKRNDKSLKDYIEEGFNSVLNVEESVYYQSSDYNKWQLFNATTQAITNKAKAASTKYFDRISPTSKLYDLFNEV